MFNSSYKKLQQQNMDQSLPDQWLSINNRLQTVETWIIKLQKRLLKLEKYTQKQSQQMNLAQQDIKVTISQALKHKNSSMFGRQSELQLQNIKAQIQNLHDKLKRSQKKNTQMFKEFKYSSMSQNVIQDRENQLQEKIQRHVKQIKRDVDGKLKQFKKQIQRSENQLKKSRQEVANFQKRKNYDSPLRQSGKSRSITKSFKKQEDHKFKTDNQQKQHVRSSRKNQQNISSSRVSYLRDKLKQFEQINKKYEEFDNKNITMSRINDKKAIQKMKDIKDYLEQSQSQIDQSHLQNDHPTHDALKKWRSEDRYRKNN